MELMELMVVNVQYWSGLRRRRESRVDALSSFTDTRVHDDFSKMARYHVDRLLASSRKRLVVTRTDPSTPLLFEQVQCQKAMSGAGFNLLTIGVVTVASVYAATYTFAPAFEEDRQARLKQTESSVSFFCLIEILSRAADFGAKATTPVDYGSRTRGRRHA